MKSIITILLCLLAYSYAFAQSPQSINYQAVIRNDAGVIVPNKTIKLRFSIQEGISSPPQYVEIHQAITNSVGLINLAIGKGSAQSGTFAGINWGLGTKFLKIEVDIAGGTNFSLIGTQQFLSVPFAMYAEKSGNSVSNWNLNGNSLTGSEFIGSNNNQPLVFKTNGLEKARITTGGLIGINTSNPLYRLHIEGEATGYETGADSRSFIFIKNTSNSNASAAGISISSGTASGEARLWHIAPTYSLRPQDQDFTTLYSSGRGISLWSSPKSNPSNGGYLKFQTGVKPDNSGGYDRLVINESGNVGIGTSNPSAQLHTTGSVLFAGIGQNNGLSKVIVADANGSLAWRDASTLSGGSSSGWGLNGNSLAGTEFIGSNNNQPIIFKTNSAERGRISNTGMVGFGTNNPLYKLHIEAEATGYETGADSRSFIFIKNTSNSNASAAGISISSGTTSGEARLWHIAPTYSLRPQDQDFTTLYSSGKGISLWSSPKSNPSSGGYLKFQTGVKPDNSGGYDRLVINEAGNVGIGNSSPKAKVQVTGGDVYIDNSTKGIIMKSPNGSCFRVTVADNGTLISTPISCPN